MKARPRPPRFAALDEAAGLDPSDGEVRAVVIGGGTGAPVSLRTLLSLGAHTSAIVAMADDGGSTGILREEANVTPPGDIRKCIAAMAADPDDPLTRAFKYRFTFARNHTLGNLMISALEDATGSFPEAIAICERLLGARGKVYPSTLTRVTLSARTRDGRELVGQAVACHSRTALERVRLNGESIEPYRPALDAIRAADLIVLGPGSLFTSIIPNLLVPGVIDAIRESKGACVFVCSLADMQGETWGSPRASITRRSATTGCAVWSTTCWSTFPRRCPWRDSPTRRSLRRWASSPDPGALANRPIPMPSASVPSPSRTKMPAPSRSRGPWSSRATWSIPSGPRGTIPRRCARRS